MSKITLATSRARIDADTLHELEQKILRKEPSFFQLQQKTLRLLRGSITGLGRMQVIADILADRPPPMLCAQFRFCLEEISKVTRFIDELEIKDKKSSAPTELNKTNAGEQYDYNR